jgi:hypothetical protein
MVGKMKNLNFLDDRPVWQLERLASEAFLAGGKQAEMKVRRE